MNKLYRLRRELVLRLIVFEYDLYGQLELLNDIMFGTPTAVEARLATGQLDPGTIQVVSKAILQYSVFISGTLNIEDFQIAHNAIYGASEALASINGIGGILANLIANYATPIAASGQLPIYTNMFGSGMIDSPRRYRSGEIVISAEDWAALLTLDSDPIHSYALLKKKGPILDGMAGVVATVQENEHLYGKIIIQDLLLKALAATGAPSSVKSSAYISTLLSGNTIQTNKLKFGGGQVNQLDALLAPAAIDTGQSRATSSRLMTGNLVMRGQVNSQITKITSGLLTFGMEVEQGRARAVVDGFTALKRQFLEGGLQGYAKCKNNTTLPIHGTANPYLTMLGKGILGRAEMPVREFVLYDFDAFSTLQTRKENELLPLVRDLVITTFHADSSASYQWRAGIRGQLIIPDDFASDSKSENHTTMIYQIIPDEENGGVTYNITTNYNKDVDGIVSIGWRYFGYLIE